MEDFYNIPVLIVNLVSKAWCVDDRQLHPHPLFLNVCTHTQEDIFQHFREADIYDICLL